MLLSILLNKGMHQLVYSVDGKRKSISTKTKSKTEAYRFLAEFKYQLDQPVEEIKYIRLYEFREEYLAYIKQSKTSNYVRSVQLSFDQLSKTTGDQLLKDISTRILDQFISVVFSRSPYAARLYYSTLKAAFSKAIRWNYLNQNPLKKIKAPIPSHI
jgi:hypothetical protein